MFYFNYTQLWKSYQRILRIIKLISVWKEHVTANTLINEMVPEPVPESVQSALWVCVIPDGPRHEDVLTEAAARVCVRGSPFLKTDA